MKKNLVTGGSGFLGSHVVEALLARGEGVRALVRPTSKISHLESLGVELVNGDLRDIESLKVATHGVERVYHCAALAADWGDWADFRAVNVTGVRNLLEASLESGVGKFIHVSTTDVYGHPDYPADESAPHRLRGWQYGDTKTEGEKLVWDYHRQRGLPVTVIRPANIYGPRSTSFVLEVVDLLKTDSMVHIGDGTKPAGLIYVTNVVDLMLLAADNENSVGQAYNATDGSDITWRQYVNRMAEITGLPAPRIVIPHRLAYFGGWLMETTYSALHIQSRPLLTRMFAELFSTHQGFSIEKARRELGYTPKVDFAEGMRRVEAWLRETNVI
jgi:nucleoside-diphosphate-sugar epimerase